MRKNGKLILTGFNKEWMIFWIWKKNKVMEHLFYEI